MARKFILGHRRLTDVEKQRRRRNKIYEDTTLHEVVKQKDRDRKRKAKASKMRTELTSYILQLLGSFKMRKATQHEKE